jgi:hypothetical protein
VREKIEEINLNQQIGILSYLNKELSNQQKSKEEKIEGIVKFCLDYLNQGVKED